MTKPIEQVLPREERDEIRQKALERRGRHYSPWLHLGATSAFGIAAIVGAASLLHDVRGWELGLTLAFLVLSNASEWRLHRSVLHQRTRAAPFLYDRHTPEHHLIFITDDMAIRHSREFRLVLIPAFAILLILLILAPLFGTLWLLGQHNLAALFWLASAAYVLSYEWLHLSFHLPADSWVGSWGLIRFLRRHHAIHHDPRLMQRWNFNVTVPLWDWVRRTYVRDRNDVVAVGR
jgi:hypothetical protein